MTVTAAATLLLNASCGGLSKRTSSIVQVQENVPPAKGMYRVKLRGDPGLHVTGSLKADMLEQKVDTRVPADFDLEASTLLCAVKKMQGAGVLRLEVWRDGKQVGQSEAPGPNGGVRAEVGPRSTIFTTY